MFAVTVLAQLENRGGRIKEPLPSSVNLQDAKKVEMKDSAGQVVLSGKFEERTASLTGAGSAKGSAAIDIQGDGSSASQALEATVEGLPGATRFKLIVDGNEVGSFSTDRTGKRVIKFTRNESDK